MHLLLGELMQILPHRHRIPYRERSEALSTLCCPEIGFQDFDSLALEREKRFCYVQESSKWKACCPALHFLKCSNVYLYSAEAWPGLLKLPG